MNRWNLIVAALPFVFVAADWPHFRGPQSASTAEKADLPLTWSDKADNRHNVAWKVPVAGRGVSGPIVVGKRLFLTTNDGAKQQRLNVTAYDTETGSEVWRRSFWATGRTATHPSSANAAPTPASDGQRLFAFFSSNDLICLDLEGNLLWYRGLSLESPKTGNDIGMASSPVVAGDTVVVQLENFAESFAAGLNVETGETRWKIARNNKPCWTSPLLLPAHGARPVAVLLQSPDGLTAVDPKTGSELWRSNLNCGGVPSSLLVQDRLFVPANGLTALDFVAGSNSPTVTWNANKLRPAGASPVHYDGLLYTITDGVLKAGQASDGEVVWQTRIQGKHWATPIVAGGHIYCIDDAGNAKVIKLGEKGEVIGTSEFGEAVFSTPAVAGDGLYVRSAKHLWKVAKTK